MSNGFKDPIWRVCCDDRIYTKCSKVNITYECDTCKRPNTITLPLFYRRLNKERKGCNTCCHTDNKNDVMELIKQSLSSFEEMDDDFKNNYFRKYLTMEEFDRIKSKIISFQHDRIQNVSEYQYIPSLIVSNQFRFYPHIYHSKTDTIAKLNYIKFRCESCGEVFETKTLEIHKNKYKINCGNCVFTNNVVKIMTTKNIKDEAILFHSKFQKKLVDFCNSHNILIKNGPKIPYEWNDKIHTYRIDFFLPDYDLMINMWHRDQINSGKWQAKEQAAKSLYENFIVVYPTNYMAFLKSLTTKI